MGTLRHIACVLSLIALGFALLAPNLAPVDQPDIVAMAHDCTADPACPATMANGCAACVLPWLAQSAAFVAAFPTTSALHPIPAGPDVVGPALSQEPPPPRG